MSRPRLSPLALFVALVLGLASAVTVSVADAALSKRTARSTLVCSPAAASARSRATASMARRLRTAGKAKARTLRSRLRATRAAQRGCRSARKPRPASCAGAAATSSFRVGAPACWRPYSDSSPWNRKVGPGVRLAPRSSQIVSRMLSWGSAQQMRAGHADTDGDYDHPVYFSKSTDPVYTLHATQDWGTADIEGAKIHVPAQARPAAGGDGHMAVITEDGWEYDMWTVSKKGSRGGTLEFGWGGRTRIDGDGLDSNATAAHFGLAGGIIRAPEMQAQHIDHALFMGVKCTDAKSASVYPAAPDTGEPCSEDGLSNSDAPPLGSRFVLDMSSAQIEALNVPRWKKTILHALADYGMIAGDAFGSGAWGLQMESGSSYTSFGQADPNGTFAKSVGASEWDGSYLFDLQDGVDWKRYLRLVDPCVSRGTC